LFEGRLTDVILGKAGVRNDRANIFIRGAEEQNVRIMIKTKFTAAAHDDDILVIDRRHSRSEPFDPIGWCDQGPAGVGLSTALFDAVLRSFL